MPDPIFREPGKEFPIAQHSVEVKVKVKVKVEVKVKCPSSRHPVITPSRHHVITHSTGSGQALRQAQDNARYVILSTMLATDFVATDTHLSTSSGQPPDFYLLFFLIPQP